MQSIKPKGFGVIVRTVEESTIELEKTCRICLADGMQCKITNRSSSVKIFGAQ
jgi:hypothetical protein